MDWYHRNAVKKTWVSLLYFQCNCDHGGKRTDHHQDVDSMGPTVECLMMSGFTVFYDQEACEEVCYVHDFHITNTLKQTF